MAEGQTNLSNDSANPPTSLPLDTTKSAMLSSSSSRAKRKLGRAGGKTTWMHKSFDQSALPPSGGPLVNKPIRRQNSASEFFQSVLTKSRSHLLSLFHAGAKKDNTNRHSGQHIRDRVSPSWDTASSAGGVFQKECDVLRQGVPNIRMPKANSYNSIPNSSHSLDNHQHRLSDSHLRGDSPGTSPTNRLLLSTKSDINKTTDTNHQLKETSTPVTDMFQVTKTNDDDDDDAIDDDPGTNGRFCSRFGESSHSLNSPKEDPDRDSTRSRDTNRTAFAQYGDAARPWSSCSVDDPRVSSPVVEFTRKGGMGAEGEYPSSSRQISSAPMARQRASIDPTHLSAGHVVAFTKRALVKSNSDTLAHLNSGPAAPIVKASSDGNCFKFDTARTSSSSSSSSSSVARVLTRITDYLFMGSVEAAYSEPLLCKYKISSLVDMTNINPRLVPFSKKTDCPCACVNKNHFRSKLNIGVDDIEWEKLEQYFKEINAFIEGTRKKRGRTLIFSYMGQSRAPAAVIQHLMYHYEMSYKEALSIVMSKRPEIKLNPGFVKTLERWEVKLVAEREAEERESGDEEEEEKKKKFSSSSMSFSSLYNDTGCAEKGGGKSRNERKERNMSELFPPVVRGAWLEC